VIIPEENAKDLAEIPANVTEGLEIKPVRWIDEVLDLALERPIQAASGAVKRIARSAAKQPKVAKRAVRSRVADKPRRPH
jgi:ATP-dependent Lon protease